MLIHLILHCLLGVFFVFRNQRSDFKSEPCKMVSLIGCQILLGDNTLHPDLFQIIDPARGEYSFTLN